MKGLRMHSTTAQGPPLTVNSEAKQRPSTSPSRPATSPKDTPRDAILERRKRPKCLAPIPHLPSQFAVFSRLLPPELLFTTRGVFENCGPGAPPNNTQGLPKT